MSPRRTTVTIALAWLGLAAGCNEPEERPQVVVHVDMDMLLVSQLDETTSAAAVLDTLRIEVLAADRSVLDVRQVAIGSTEDLPFSFGIASELGEQVHVRVRAFRAALATAGQTITAASPDPVALLDPPSLLTVDRVLTVAMPALGVEHVNVVLHGECMGIPPSFGEAEIATCVDDPGRRDASTGGVASGAKEETDAGTWWRSTTLPCNGTPPVGTRCVPGGLSIIGDPLFVARNELEYDAVPARMTFLSPMFMDETEMTVGMLRKLIGAGYAGPLPDPKEPDDGADQYCSFDPGSAADLPLNCVSKETATALCAARGGFVPTEAQWDHAARGRGGRRVFPWGSELPDCCTATFGRSPGAGCDGTGPLPVKTHMGSDSCDADVSRDGIADLAGSLAELTRDAIGTYDDDCWHTSESAISEDPICEDDDLSIARGASWAMPVGDVPLPIRRSFSSSDSSYGFRCVFEATP